MKKAKNKIDESKDLNQEVLKMDNKDVIEMLKEMQIETAKCVGFIVGTVTQAWVITELLGKRIEELGGEPYHIKNGKMIID